MKFDNFWHTDRIIRGILNIHLTQFMLAHYRVKCKFSKLLHYMVNINIVLFIFSLSIWQKMPC